MRRVPTGPRTAQLTFGILLAAAASAHAEPLPPSVTSRPPTPTPEVLVPYGGGAVVTAPVNMYVIWYGDWSASSATSSVISTFLSNSDSTLDPWLNILSTYPNAAGTPAATTATFAGQTTTTVTGATVTIGGAQGITTIITNAVSSGALPSDPTGFYFVMGAPNVTYTDSSLGSGCSNFCGFHNSVTLGGAAVPYAFIQNVNYCSSHGLEMGCALGLTATGTEQPPNGDVAGDSMIYVISHELAEGITDPQPYAPIANGYGNAAGEVADVCASEWGPDWLANGSSSEVGTWLAAREICVGVEHRTCHWVYTAYILPTLDVNVGGGFCAMELPKAPNCTITPGPCEGLPQSRTTTFSCLGASGDVTQNVLLQYSVGDGWYTLDQIPVQSTGYPLTPYTASVTVRNGGATYRACTENADGNGGLLCTPIASSDECTFQDPSPRSD